METYQLLIDHHIKPSVQRMAIMDYLLTHRTHPTADEVYTALSPSLPTLSKTTVYNTLRLFAEQKAALMLTIDEHNVHFDGDTHPHAHLICRQCNHIYDSVLPASAKRAKRLTEEGHQVDETHIYYRGRCTTCMTKEQQ